MQLRKGWILTAAILVILLAAAISTAQTTGPGHTGAKWDADGNGYPDVALTMLIG
jgi:hypothetical protein